ncbi:TetR/AcrR family transcriptional regulator [Micromonospora sp. NBC_01813]|uniref:TetR/AcrR family transcriptional regulator n=1 Tax=Micromonospora sp. NBC_01813 TaxID=2975988 RepID=UPI002DDC2153|nr:TetR/AcrR family transcriptional regulator [Micromonospora sp. NBC_01813]WSA06181.1 TetR family transcriptional regulator [Micromonospora sp. NBC_01813]
MPKRVDHEQRRRQIGEALLRIASSRGLQAASMREVAVEAGVSLRLVQYYFHSKQELLLGALGYLGEQLSARVTDRIRSLGSPTPRNIVFGTLTAILPTDAESRQLTRTYAAYYTLVLAEPDLAREHGASYPDALERFLARQLRDAQQAGQVDADLDADTVAAGLLAMTNGLGSSVLGGQRDGAAALAILTYHLDQLFSRTSPV